MGSAPKPAPTPPPPPPPAPPVERKDVSAQMELGRKTAGRKRGYASTILTSRLGGSEKLG